ncbi:MAG TPA: hypothetical protein VMT46_13670 [Anaerolineaceae bacterium]|nr:hypothetical protein [Anaerolineaceae bacterium]
MSIPVLIIMVILQIGVASQLPLLRGTADLVLVTLVAWSMQERVKTSWQWALVGGFLVSYVSALPTFAPLWGYLIVTGLVRIINRRIWQTPILVMFLMTFIGTLTVNAVSIFALRLEGVQLPLLQALNTIVLPSALLNLILAIPIYALISDLANRLYPVELEV